MMKKKIMAGVVVLSMAFGGVAGATATKLIYTKEGLKDNYRDQYEQFQEDLKMELDVYEEDKVAQLEEEAERYFNKRKDQIRADRKAQIDAQYEQAKKEVFQYIDRLFDQGGNGK